MNIETYLTTAKTPESRFVYKSGLGDFLEKTYNNKSIELSISDNSFSEEGLTLILNKSINAVLNSGIFSEKHADILIKRTGINGEGIYTLDEIGGRYNLSRERIRQCEQRAFRQLRQDKIKLGKEFEKNLLIEYFRQNPEAAFEVYRQKDELYTANLGLTSNIAYLTEEVVKLKSELGQTVKEQQYQSRQNILSQSVETLELSVRSSNLLKNAGIKTIIELQGKSEKELSKLGFGRKSINEIKEVLADDLLGLNNS